MIYFVAEADGRIIGGGGICEYFPGSQVSLTFGVVSKDELRRGYGTAILLARLAFIDPGSKGCEILLEATEWSSDFFSRLGFKWHDHSEDLAGNIFFHGTHMVLPGDRQIFQRILDLGEVTFASELTKGNRNAAIFG
ncbi:MAG: GNAT family N-acetyltransferase [Akkermansiaceae bacterium]|nr:GNAT family N-acetyltransferase [Akkermansiaceae bacterium]